MKNEERRKRSERSRKGEKGKKEWRVKERTVKGK